MTIFSVYLDGKKLIACCAVANAFEAIDSLGMGIRVISLQTRKFETTLHLSRKPVMTRRKCGELACLLKELDTALAVIFGSRCTDVDIALVFKRTIAQEAVRRQIVTLIDRLKLIKRSATVFSMNQFFLPKSSGDTAIHLMAYHGFEELRLVEPRLLLEAMCCTGEFVRGSSRMLNSECIDSKTCVAAIASHTNTLKLLRIELITNPQGVRWSLLAKQCEYQLRHALLADCRRRIGFEKHLYTRHGLIVRLLSLCKPVAQSYVDAMSLSRAAVPDNMRLSHIIDNVMCWLERGSW